MGITSNAGRVRARLHGFQRSLGAKALDATLKDTMETSLSMARRLTPVGWTGETRQAWRLIRHRTSTGGGWSIANDSRTFRFLDKGTKDHGPKTARALFIPLSRSAALGGWSPGMKYGKDYILVKRVRGIKPRRIVKQLVPLVRSLARSEVKRMNQQALSRR